MKTINSATLAIVLSVGTAHAGVIALGTSWTTGTNDSVALTGESATGFTAATTRGAWMYQLASADFASEAFGIGDTVTMSFTTTLNANATTDPLDFRIAMWDETGQGGASARMDWGPLTGTDSAGAGVGDNMETTPTSTTIGSYDGKVTSLTATPTAAFITAGSSVDVSYSVTKQAANLFDVSLTWDDMTISQTGLANGTGHAFDSISGVGIRLNAGAGNVNNFTVSNLSVQVQSVPEPSSAALLGLGGLALILRRRK